MERAKRAILFADIVESVRLVDVDEEGVIRRWLDLVEMTRRNVIPSLGGRFIKGLGDGMMLEFPDVRSAAAASFRIHELARSADKSLPADRRIYLRIGVSFDDVIVLADDRYGRGVILASRLMTLAGPGETVVSEEVRDGLVSDVDCEIEDLGENYLRHMPTPVRAYRIGPPGPDPKIPSMVTQAELRPALAVIPFAPRGTPAGGPIGEVVAEEIIRNVSRSGDINVISRLSTTALSARLLTAAEIGERLKADYILGGVFSTEGETLTVDAELAEARSGHVIWTDRLTDRVTALVGDGQEMIERIAAKVTEAVIMRELARSRSRPLPTLRAYTLLLSAIALMHRMSRRDYVEARRLLETLIERGRRQAIPHAWLANWHVLKVIQGWSDDLQRDANQALENSELALEADPECAHALAVDGFVQTHLLKRFDVAETRYDLALFHNPNHTMARLLKGTMHAFTDQGGLAVAETEHAMRLSPLDPHRFLYEAHCAGAHLSAGNYGRAIELAESSRRANRCHSSTLRILTVAYWEAGRKDEARKTALEVLKNEPTLTVGGYLKRSPNADFKIGKRVAKALKAAGVPD